MKPLHEYINSITQPPLLIGKGPSFKLKNSIDLNKFNSISLNHSISYIKADICSAIDIDVIDDVGDDIYNNAKNLMMPWHPHVLCSATDKTLLHFVSENKILQKMDNEGRLYWFNLKHGITHRPEGPVYTNWVNSGDTIYGILAFHAFENDTLKTTYSIGIDGGSEYDKTFENMKLRECWGRTSFNKQLGQINQISQDYNTSFIRLEKQQT